MGPRCPVPMRAAIRSPGIRSACAIALHAHQSLIPAGGEQLRAAQLIGNLHYMLEPNELETPTEQRRGCVATTSTANAPSSTSSRRPASSPDVSDGPTNIERRTAHALKAREANLTRTPRPGEARPRRDRPARL